MLKNNGWKVTQAEFRGFVKAKLEGQGRELGEIKKAQKTQFEKIDVLEVEIANVKGFAKGTAVIGATLGAIAGFFARWLK